MIGVRIKWYHTFFKSRKTYCRILCLSLYLSIKSQQLCPEYFMAALQLVSYVSVFCFDSYAVQRGILLSYSEMTYAIFYRIDYCSLEWICFSNVRFRLMIFHLILVTPSPQGLESCQWQRRRLCSHKKTWRWRISGWEN